MCALGGRPKEEGGHKRKNVTLSQETLKVLKEIKEKYGDIKISQLIEYLIKSYPEMEDAMIESLAYSLASVFEILNTLSGKENGDFDGDEEFEAKIEKLKTEIRKYFIKS